MSAPAIAGAGGCGIRPCPMKWSANWQEPLKQMNCITRLVVRGKPNRVGKSLWAVGHVVAARSASRAGGIMTKTDPR
jgi:hypothetical protein